MKRTSILLLVCAGLLAASAANAKPRSVSPALDHIQPGSAISERFLARDARGGVLVSLFLEGDVPPGLLRARGIEVNAVAGRFMTARCPLGLLTALLETPGIDRVQVAEPVEPLLDQSIPDVNAAGIRLVPPPAFSGQTGAGVIAGIVDTGVDWTHQDFKWADGTTRLVSLWDQTDTGGPPPSGYSYGTEWTTAQINAGVSREADTDGHGSHVMGIVAGDGSATGNGQPAYQFVGVAPEADLCVVKTTFSSASIADGVDYIFQRAAALGKQAVVNLSLGTQAGPHDGTYEQDVTMSQLTGPGRIIVASAGNKGIDNLHGKVFVPPATPLSMTLNVPAYQKTPGTGNDYLLFSGWYEGADAISLTIVTPNGITQGPVTTGTSLLGQNTGDGYLNIYNATTVPSNGDNEIYIELFDAFANKTPEVGTWTFTFTPVSIGSTGRVDMYLYGNHLGNGSSLAMWMQGLDPEGVVGSPGSADGVIAVAAHTTKDCWDALDGFRYCWNPRPPLDEIADFSSHGPRRDGIQKPDLSAPGFSVMSAKSADYAIPNEYVSPDGQHFNQAGTSMSSPHVAGAVALLLAQPAWSGSPPSAVRARLGATARADAFTGAVPNPTWGHGKLDVGALLAPVFTMQIPHPAKGSYIPPGRADSVTVVTGGLSADSVLVGLSLNGGVTYPVVLGTLHVVTPGPPRRIDFFVADSLVTTQARVRGIAFRGASRDTAYSDSLFLIQAPVAVEPEGVTAAPRFALLGNAPNPFNPSTTIRFEIGTPGPVTLRIYSAAGRLVRTLVREPLSSGRYRTIWNGQDDRGATVGSGVYVYQISSQGRTIARKMTLLK
jgi:subtilisin family serine protease